MLMMMERLNCPRITQRGGNLRGLRRKMLRQTLPYAQHFQEESTIVRPHIERVQRDAVDQSGRVQAPDNGADSRVAFGRGNRDRFYGGSAHSIVRLARSARPALSDAAYRAQFIGQSP